MVLPRLQLRERVAADDEHHVVGGPLPTQRGQRVHRVARPVAPKLEVVGHEARMHGGGQGDHGEAVPRRAGRGRPMRRDLGREEAHLVEAQLFAGVLGRAQMAEVDGVESAAHDPDLHG